MTVRHIQLGPVLDHIKLAIDSRGQASKQQLVELKEIEQGVLVGGRADWRLFTR